MNCSVRFSMNEKMAQSSRSNFLWATPASWVGDLDSPTGRPPRRIHTWFNVPCVPMSIFILNKVQMTGSQPHL